LLSQSTNTPPVKPEDSLSCIQTPATGKYHEPDKSHAHPNLIPYGS